MEEWKPVSTPLITGFKLNKGDEFALKHHTLYRSAIGRLLYVIPSALYVMQAIGNDS